MVFLIFFFVITILRFSTDVLSDPWVLLVIRDVATLQACGQLHYYYYYYQCKDYRDAIVRTPEGHFTIVTELQ